MNKNFPIWVFGPPNQRGHLGIILFTINSVLLGIWTVKYTIALIYLLGEVATQHRAEVLFFKFDFYAVNTNSANE